MRYGYAPGSASRCRTQRARDDTHTLGRMPALSTLLPSQAAARNTAWRQVTSRGEADPALQMPPWEREGQVLPSQLRTSRAGWPAALQRLGLPSASRGSGTAPGAAPLASPMPSAPGAPVSEACGPPAFHRLRYIWDALPLNCQSHYGDQVNVANLYIYCLGK